MLSLNNVTIEQFILPLASGILAALMGWAINQLPSIRQSPTYAISTFIILAKLIIEIILLSIIINQAPEVLAFTINCQSADLTISPSFMLSAFLILAVGILLDFLYLIGWQSYWLTSFIILICISASFVIGLEQQDICAAPPQQEPIEQEFEPDPVKLEEESLPSCKVVLFGPCQ